MAKIAIDARELNTSTGKYISKLLEYLQKIDISNEYLVLLKPKDLGTWQPNAKNFKKVACPHKEFTFDEQIGFYQQIKNLKPDLVHFGMVQQPLLYRGRKVTTMHDLTTTRFKNPSKNSVIFSMKQFVYKWANKRVARDSDQIITVSDYVKDDVAEFAGISAGKITTTYLAADNIIERPEKIKSLGSKDFLMYVGRPLPHKNLSRLVDAFAIVLQKNPEIKLVLCGKKDILYERLEKRVSKLGLGDSVIITGFVSEGQLRWLYEHTKAYIFPSLSEGFGLPGLEAMVHGAPVVSSNATCLPEIYGDAAEYFDPLDVNDMAKAIEHVITDESVRKGLIKKSKKQVAKYSWERCARQTLDVYNKALNSR